MYARPFWTEHTAVRTIFFFECCCYLLRKTIRRKRRFARLFLLLLLLLRMTTKTDGRENPFSTHTPEEKQQADGQEGEEGAKKGE